MKAAMLDADPGDRDPGDGELELEAPAAAAFDHLSFRPAAAPVLGAGTSLAGRDALDDALELLRRKRNDESHRAAVWNGLDGRTRRLVVWAGGLDQKRAESPLASFDAFERGIINVSLSNVIRALERAQVAMQGGAMPSTRPDFERSAGQGITAPAGRVHH